MKKWLVLILSAMLMLGLMAGCSSSTEEQSNTNKEGQMKVPLSNEQTSKPSEPSVPSSGTTKGTDKDTTSNTIPDNPEKKHDPAMDIQSVK